MLVAEFSIAVVYNNEYVRPYFFGRPDNLPDFLGRQRFANGIPLGTLDEYDLDRRRVL